MSTRITSSTFQNCAGCLAYTMFNPLLHILILRLGVSTCLENCVANCHLLRKFDQSKIVIVIGASACEVHFPLSVGCEI